MNIGIRILKDSSILRFLLFRIFIPLWHWIISMLEAIYWTIKAGGQDRHNARFIVACMRGDSVEDLAHWYAKTKFKYKSDPARGMFDYSSRPWVTVLKMYGDCDDMARLAYSVLGLGGAAEWNYDLIEWIVLYGKRGGHAVTLARDPDVGYWLMNNQYMEGPFKHKWDAIEAANFGEVPDLWLVYKKREGCGFLAVGPGTGDDRSLERFRFQNDMKKYRLPW